MYWLQAHLALEARQIGRFVRGNGGAGRAATLEDMNAVELSARNDRLATIFGSHATVHDSASRRRRHFSRRRCGDFLGFTVDDVPPLAHRSPSGLQRNTTWATSDGCHVSLYWIRPGRPIPTHTHDGSELTLVLDGAFTDVTGQLWAR